MTLMFIKTASLYLLAQISPTGLPTPKFESALPNVFRIAMAVAAVMSIVFIAIGGLKYTLSAGDPQGIVKAKNTIMYAIIGLVIAVLSFTIISFVTGRLV